MNRKQHGAAGLTFSFLASFKNWKIIAPIMLVKNNNSLGFVFFFFPAFVGKVKFMAIVELKCQREEVQGIGGGY